MAKRGMGRSSDLSTWSTGAGRALEEAPVPQPASSAQRKSRKFTALLDADTDARYGRLLAELVASVGPIATRQDGTTGRVRTGYDPSRADLLRALLAVAEADPAVRQAVYQQVRHDFTTS